MWLLQSKSRNRYKSYHQSIFRREEKTNMLRAERALAPESVLDEAALGGSEGPR